MSSTTFFDGLNNLGLIFPTTALFLGVHTYMYVAYDRSGNIASCGFNITVVRHGDFTPPVITKCPAVTQVL